MDYTFLSKEEFLALEKSGDLLESGVYDGEFFHFQLQHLSNPGSVSSLRTLLKHQKRLKIIFITPIQAGVPPVVVPFALNFASKYSYQYHYNYSM